MKLDTTRQPLGVVLVTVALLIILFWSRAVAYPLPIEQNDVWLSPLGRWINSLNFSFGRHFISIVLVMIQAIVVARIGTKNMLYTAKTFIPMIFFTIMACGIYVTAQSFNLLIASMAVIIGFELFISGFHRPRNVGSCFAGAILFGTAGLIYTPYFVLLPMIPIILALFFRDPRERIAAIIGSLVPLFLCAYIEWGAGGSFAATPRGVVQYFFSSCRAPLRIESLTLATGFIFAILILITTLSVGALGSMRRHIRTRPMRISVAAIVMLTATVVLLLLPSASAGVIQMTALPMAIIVPQFFVRYSGRAAFLIYILLIMSAIMLNVVRMA